MIQKWLKSILQNVLFKWCGSLIKALQHSQLIAVPKNLQIITKTIPEKTLNKIDVWWMSSTEYSVTPGRAISRTAPINQWLQNYLFVFLYVEDHATIFFDGGLCCLCLFSEKTVSLRESPLKICKTVRNEEPTVKPWERQWKRVTHSETVRVKRSVFEILVPTLLSLQRRKGWGGDAGNYDQPKVCSFPLT